MNSRRSTRSRGGERCCASVIAADSPLSSLQWPGPHPPRTSQGAIKPWTELPSSHAAKTRTTGLSTRPGGRPVPDAAAIAARPGTSGIGRPKRSCRGPNTMPPDTSDRLELFDPTSSTLLAMGFPLRQLSPSGGDFRCLDGGAKLLDFYFLKGKRDVRVRSGANEGLVATLGTRWIDGRRQWTLRW